MEIKTTDESTFFSQLKAGELHQLTIVVSLYPVRFILQALDKQNEPLRVRTHRSKRQKQYSSDKVFSLLHAKGLPIETIKLSRGLGSLDIDQSKLS